MKRIVKNWSSIAKKYPNNKRNCIKCNIKTLKGSIFCNNHKNLL